MTSINLLANVAVKDGPVEKPGVVSTTESGKSGFEAPGLHPSLVSVTAALGYEEPTAIQREAIPPLLEGRDVLGQAATGTGKTAAFALPMLQRVAKNRADAPAVRGMILVPTRELAMQVAEAVHKYGRALGTRVLPIYGGQSIGQQLRALSRGVDDGYVYPNVRTVSFGIDLRL